MKTLLICVALIGLLFGQDQPSPMVIFAQKPHSMVIANDDGPMVTLSLKDGSVVYGNGYTPDEAAKKFWEAISRQYGEVCQPKAKADNP